MSVVLVCPFDPITISEIEFAKEVMHQRNLKKIYLMPFGNGILSANDRIALIQKAIAPFKKMEMIDCIVKEDEIITYPDYEEDELEARNGNFMMVPANIRDYMNQNGFYYMNIAQAHCSSSRFQHSVRVANVSKQIAQWHNLDEMQAYRTGLLHDVTKNWSKEDSEAVISVYKPEWLSLSEKIWHSFTATIFLKQNLGLHDEKMLYAIEHHTLGDGNTPLAQIIYIADKIEPGRGYDVTRHMELAKKDLGQAVELIQYESKKYRLEKEGKNV